MKYLYILRAKGYWLRFKLGISKDVKKRVGYIERSSEMTIVIVARFELWNVEFWEKVLLFIYRPLRCRSMEGSGKTEWVWSIFPLFTLLFLSFLWAWQRHWILILFFAALGTCLWWHIYF